MFKLKVINYFIKKERNILYFYPELCKFHLLQTIIVMKNLFIACIFVIFIYSCTKDNDYLNNGAIYSSSEEFTVKEILLFLKPYTIIKNDTLYLNTDSIFNIKVNINGKPFGTFKSIPFPLISNSDTINNLLYTKLPLKYPIRITKQLDNLIPQTAGEYANLLINYYSLKPGFYFLSIPSFTIKLIDGTEKVVYTPICEVIEIKQNVTTMYIGTFNVYIN